MFKQSPYNNYKSYGAYCNVVRDQGLEPVPYYKFRNFDWISPMHGRKKYWIEKTNEINGKGD